MAVSIGEIDVADSADAWARAGFGVDSDGRCRIGGVAIRLLGRDAGTGIGTGIVGWSLDGVPATVAIDQLDGIPTRRATTAPAAPGTHPNGVVAIDHVVQMSPDLARTVSVLAALGVTPRRERDTELGDRPIRQVFFRFGEVIVEVIGSPTATSDDPSTLWGITYAVADIDATAAYFGAHTAPVKDAVQPGRRITTLAHRDLGMSVPTAMISASRRGGRPTGLPILGA